MPPRFAASAPDERIVDEADVLAELQLFCWPYETMADPQSTRRSAQDALEHLLGLGLPYAARAAGRAFAPYEVATFLVWAHLRLGDPLWANTCVVAQRRMAREHAAGSELRFGVAMERDVPYVGRPAALVRTQVALPSEGSEGAPQSAIGVTLRAGRGVTFVRSGDVADARWRVDGSATLHLELDFGFRTSWRDARVEPERVEPFRAPDPLLATFLATSEGPIVVTDRVRALARDLAGDSTTPWQALRRFWAYLFETITIGNVPYERLRGPDLLWSTLEFGRADCWHAAALLVGLCRARGIAARVVGGLLLYRPAVSFHYWCEVHVPPFGWVPCDFALSWACAAGDARRPESDVFLGRLDPRLVVERFPRRQIVLGPRLPKRFFLQPRAHAGGTEFVFRGLDDGATIYRDRLWLRSVSALP
jgi:transglutaminase-like putative cysteine protease